VAAHRPPGEPGEDLLMLTAATLGMAIYGVYSCGLGVAGLFGVVSLDWWANLALIVLGLLLLLSGAFVRVRMPGGLALAMGALLALQALALHNDVHFYGAVLVLPQVGRGIVAGALAGMAFWGGRGAAKGDEV
jgi:hypothetical protein